MLMTNENIRYFPHDRLFEYTILKLVPRFIKPNHLTVLRIILIPFVVYFFWTENWAWALPLFLFAALTDAMDGSLARTRKQITLWGTLADPVADKLLIGSAVVIFVAREIHPLFAVVMILIELLIVVGALYRKRRGLYASANNYGKIKMLLQVIGVSLLIVAKLAGVSLVVPFATATFALAIAFAIVSLLTYSS